MEALYLLIPLSVLAVAGALWLFLRMSDTGQFDDLDSPAHRILLDDDRAGTRPAAQRQEAERAESERAPPPG